MINKINTTISDCPYCNSALIMFEDLNIKGFGLFNGQCTYCQTKYNFWCTDFKFMSSFHTPKHTLTKRLYIQLIKLKNYICNR